MRKCPEYFSDDFSDNLGSELWIELSFDLRMTASIGCGAIKPVNARSPSRIVRDFSASTTIVGESRFYGYI